MRRALDQRDILGARAAAMEMRYVALSDALEIVILGADREPDRHARMALRWTVRFGSEIRGVTPEEAQAVLALLLLLTGPRRRGALRGLAGLLADRRELPRMADRLLEIADTGLVRSHS
jgi:hypothetical protein